MRRTALPVSLAAAVSVALSLLVPATASAVEPAPALAAARDAAYDRYQSVLKPALSTPLGWTGSVDTCDPGAPSVAGQAATLAALNFVRELAGLTPVVFDPALDAKAQQAALMMDAQNDLSHYPGASWACRTVDGAAAAGQSNLHLGHTGARAITGYMEDPGAGNNFVGHRRWILFPPQKAMGSGSTSGANALHVFGQHDNALRGPDWVSWPAPGWFPAQLEPRGRWSLSAPDKVTDFSGARVSVRRGGVELPVVLEPVVDGPGNNTLVWQVTTGPMTKQADTDYEVTVSGVVRNGLPVAPHSYTTTIFDAEVDARQAITFGTIAGMRYGDVAAPKVYASSGLPVTLRTTTPNFCAVEGTTVRMTGVGVCTVNADQPGDAIRRPAPTVTQTFVVAPRPVVVRPTDVTRAQGATDPTFAVTYDGLAAGETRETSDITGTPVCLSTATPLSPVGTYPVVCDVTPLKSAHYTFTSLPGVLTVGPVGGGLPVGTSVTRLSGSDRVATAVRISQEQYAGTAPVVFLATASSFPDALAGGPAAVTADGPILLTQGATLPASTRAEIARLQPGRIFVLGGPAAVPAAVVSELQATAPVERLAGADRASTAAAVSARFFPAGVPVAFVATSANFPDALAAGAAAAASDGPVLLTGPSLSDSVRAELARLKPGRIVVVGGTNAVPAAVLTALGAIAPASRIAGGDRYDTGARVVKAFFGPAQTTTAVLATGTSFPDALAGTPLAGRLGAPLVLVSRDALPAASATALTDLGVSRFLVLGGTAAISDAVASKVQALAAI